MTHRRRPGDARLFNDVLYKIKTTDEILDPLRVFVSDKEFVKLFVKATVGDEYNVPTLAVLRTRKEVDAFDFPPQCAIKPTQASGPIILRRDGEAVDRDKIKRWFDLNYYLTNREANYRWLEPKAIVEPLIFGATNLEDYKFFCVDGVPKLIQVDVDRHLDHRRIYYDAHWREQDFSIIYPKSEKHLPRPENLDEMLRVAAELSKSFGFVRVDLYSNGKQCLVGEITHCAESVEARFVPPSAERAASERLFR